MMDKLKKNMVFYLLLLIDFYIVPWFIKNTGSAMIVMRGNLQTFLWLGERFLSSSSFFIAPFWNGWITLKGSS